MLISQKQMTKFLLQTEKGEYAANRLGSSWSVDYDLNNGVTGSFLTPRWAFTRVMQFIDGLEKELV